MRNMYQTFLRQSFYLSANMLPRVPFDIVAVHDARCRSEARDEGGSTHCKDSCITKKSACRNKTGFRDTFLGPEVHRRSFHSAFNCMEVEIERLLVLTETSTQVLSG